jgi:hypothetical protein
MNILDLERNDTIWMKHDASICDYWVCNPQDLSNSDVTQSNFLILAREFNSVPDKEKTGILIAKVSCVQGQGWVYSFKHHWNYWDNMKWSVSSDKI